MRSQLLVLAFLVTFVSLGQEDNTSNNNNEDSKSENTAKQRRNEFSLELIGMVDGRFIVSYERSIGKHWSASLGAGPKSEEGLVNFSGIDGEKLKTGNLNYGGFIMVADGRYYLNEFTNGRATGFYFGLYAKYSNYQSDITGTYTSSDDISYTFLFDTSINVSSAGFMIGYKLPISKRFAFDFIIAGPGTANYGIDIVNKSEELPEEFYEDINNALEELGILDLINADFDFRIGDSSSVFNTVNFRYAISFTFNF